MKSFRFLFAAFFLSAIFSIVSSSVVFAQEGKAAQVFLKNGDRLTGRIIQVDDSTIKISSEYAGELIIKKELIEKTTYAQGETAQDVTAKEAAEKTVPAPNPWKREIAVGYAVSKGNTRKSNANVDLNVARKRDVDEFNLKGNLYYSSSEDKMDAQKWYGMMRYGHHLKENKKWVIYEKFESDHDWFANINYRLIPTVGAGYWFSDTDDWKALAEAGAGWQYTNYRDDTKSKSEMILTPRAFVEKRLIGESRISEDFTFYPSLEDTANYRFRSETVFTNPISKALALKISFIDEYNSNPANNAKKTDTRLISSLNYSF